MKIVIELDEILYGEFLTYGIVGLNVDNQIEISKAIRKGTPLPEHHGRLIDEQDISPLYHCMSHIYCEHRDCNTCQFCCVTKYEVTDAPTIIEGE